MEPLGLRFRVLRKDAQDGDHRADATIGLRFGGRQLRYVAEVKRGLRPATLGAVIHQLRVGNQDRLYGEEGEAGLSWFDFDFEKAGAGCSAGMRAKSWPTALTR
jgi:hypothetical protein